MLQFTVRFTGPHIRGRNGLATRPIGQQALNQRVIVGEVTVLQLTGKKLRLNARSINQISATAATSAELMRITTGLYQARSRTA